MSNHMTSYFTDFLSEIRLTESQVSTLKKAHETLRERLMNYEELQDVVVETFLQGSYKRSTIVRPKTGKLLDVDIVVVTNMNKDEVTPDGALEKFRPFLEKHYKGKYRKQGRSWGIELSNVELDLVPTAAPSEINKSNARNNFIRSSYDIESMLMGDFRKSPMMESMNIFAESAKQAKWKDEPLYIPNIDNNQWDKTHPLEQIRWTIEKNQRCNGHYINVVKALKWWRREKHPAAKHPKSYPLEHFIGDCCSDGVNSVAQGVTETLERIVEDYPTKPFLADRGVPEHDVFGRLTEEEYTEFYEDVKGAAGIARKAYDEGDASKAAELWRSLFGTNFPSGSEEENEEKLTARQGPSDKIGPVRFA